MHLVFVGVGRIGTALMPLLQGAGHTVTVLSRRETGDFLSPDFDPTAAAQQLPACDAVLLLAGLFELNADPERMQMANRVGPIRVAEALHARFPKAQTIAFLDSRITRDEAAIPPAVRPYWTAKRALGQWVLGAAKAWGEATGARVNAIAPGPVFPPPEKAHSEPGGRCLTPRPTVDELFAAVTFLLHAPSVTGQILYVAAGQQVLPGETATPPAPIRACLTIAGSDSGGGAGIQADLRAFRDLGHHGCSAITALTAQNPHGVSGIQPTTPELLRGQLERVAEDFDLGAVKTGMLVDAERIAVVADFLPQITAPLVVDPVMVATSGAHLLDHAAVQILRERLLPLATLLTPNLPEAQALLGANAPLDTLEAQASAARRLAERFNTAVLVKGGHSKERPATDLLCIQGAVWCLEGPTLANPLTTHGTGCALSAAIAAHLAHGTPLLTAICRAKAYVLSLLDGARPTGRTAVYGERPAHWCEADIRTTRLL